LAFEFFNLTLIFPDADKTSSIRIDGCFIFISNCSIPHQ